MLRSARGFSLLLAVATLLCGTPSRAQSVDLSWTHWDSSNRVLFAEPKGDGLVFRAYPGSPSQNIDIFRDFAGLQAVYIDSVTAGPDGETLISAILSTRDQQTKFPILTYSDSGELLNKWEPAQQSPDVIRYTSDDDAVFVLGDSDVPDGVKHYPLLVEYSPDGRILKKLIPASTMKDGGQSLSGSGADGQPALRVTKDKIYLYAPKNREVVICDRSGQVLTSRSISDTVDKLSSANGFYIEQTHRVDFTEDGDIVLELLLGNNDTHSYQMDIIRVDAKTGHATMVRQASNGRLWFIGMNNDQYLYVESGRHLYIQANATQEPVPLADETVASAQPVK
jgi:hypothetical protein